MRKQERRRQAAIKSIFEAQRKAEEGKPKNRLEAYISAMPDEEMREQYRDGVKRGREALYRAKSAGFDLGNDMQVFVNIKDAVDDPECEFVDLYYEGPVPADSPKVPWILNIKTPRGPDISKAVGMTLPCGSWPQFITAVVAYGDKEAREDIRWVLEAQGITPVEDEELKDARKVLGDFLNYYIEKQDADRDKVIDADQAFGNWVKFRLFPESEPDKVQRVANTCGKSFKETVQRIKSGILEDVEAVCKKTNTPLEKLSEEFIQDRRRGDRESDPMFALWTCMFDIEGRLWRQRNGSILTFDEIWTDCLEMDAEQIDPEENVAGDIIRRHLQKLAKQMPDKTPGEIRSGFREALEKLYWMFLLGHRSTKHFHGTSASKLEEIKQNGITSERGVWLTENNPWEANGCHPWSDPPGEPENMEAEESEEDQEKEPIQGLVLEVDLTQLDEDRMRVIHDGSLVYSGTIPWSAVNRYAVLDWGKIDGDWEHFVTHRMPGSVQNAPFTRWLMGYPVEVQDMIWPLQKYQATDTSPDSNRAWTRWEWDNHPSMPVELGDEEFEDAHSEHAIEATEEACPVEDRQSFIEHESELRKNRDGISVTVIRDTPWAQFVDHQRKIKAEKEEQMVAAA